MRATAFVLGFLFATITFATAQTTTFRSRADLVQVPVIVQDKKGEAVPGLAASDFVLEQDGKPQRIANMEEIVAASVPPTSRPAVTAALVPNTFTNLPVSGEQPQEVIIFAIDLIRMSNMDSTNARKALLKFLQTQLKPNAVVGVVVIARGEVRLLHSFTASPTVLSAALDKAMGMSHVDALSDTVDTSAIQAEAQRFSEFLSPANSANQTLIEQQEREKAWASKMDLESLRDIAQWVGGIPGRKVLMWVTGYFPWAVTMSPDGKPHFGGPQLYYEEYEWTMRTLASNNVAVYPVDVCGLPMHLSTGVTDQPEHPAESSCLDRGYLRLTGEPTSNAAGSGSIDARGAALRAGVQHLRDSDHTTMNAIADATGGRAYYNRNDLAKSFTQALDDSSHYYMLSYYVNRAETKPGWHKLKVGVGRKDITTRARAGFYFEPPAAGSAVQRQTAEWTALASPFQYTALPIMLRWLPSENGKARFNITIPSAAGLVTSTADAIDLDVMAQASNEAGNVIAQSSGQISKTLSADAAMDAAAAGFTFAGNLDLKPGTYAVRVLVRDNVSGRIGTIAAPLNVPRQAH